MESVAIFVVFAFGALKSVSRTNVAPGASAGYFLKGTGHVGM